MNLSSLQIVGTLVAVASGVISFLLTQSDISVIPAVKVALGASQVALTILALRLNLNTENKEVG